MAASSPSPELTVRATWDGVQEHAVTSTICITINPQPGASYPLFDTSHETMVFAAVTNIRRLNPIADNGAAEQRGAKLLEKYDLQDDTPDTRAAKVFFDEFMQEEDSSGDGNIRVRKRRLFPKRSASETAWWRRAVRGSEELNAHNTTPQVIVSECSSTSPGRLRLRRMGGSNPASPTASKRSLSNETAQTYDSLLSPSPPVCGKNGINPLGHMDQLEVQVNQVLVPGYLRRRHSTPSMVTELVATAGIESEIQPQNSRFLQPGSAQSTSQSLQLRGSLPIVVRTRRKDTRPPWQSPIQKDYKSRPSNGYHFYGIVQALSESTSSLIDNQNHIALRNPAVSEAKKKYVGPLHAMSRNSSSATYRFQPETPSNSRTMVGENRDTSTDLKENKPPSVRSRSSCSDSSYGSVVISPVSPPRTRPDFIIYEDTTATKKEQQRYSERIQSGRSTRLESVPDSPKLWLRYRGGSSQYFLPNPLGPLKPPCHPTWSNDKGSLTIYFPDDVLCGTYEVVIDVITTLSAPSPLGWQWFTLPGLLHLDAKLSTDASYGTFEFSLTTPPDCATPEVQFNIEALADYRINDSGRVTGAFPLYALLNLGLRAKKALSIVQKFTSDVILRATLSQTMSNMVEVKYHLSMTINLGDQDLFSDKFEFHFALRNYLAGSARIRNIDNLALDFGTQEVRRLGSSDDSTTFAVTRDQSNVKQNIDLHFRVEYGISSYFTLRVPTARPITGTVSSETVFVSQPSLPLKIEHIAQRPLSSWSVSQYSDDQDKKLFFQRLEMPSCYPEALLDDVVLKVVGLSPLQFHGFGKTLGGSVCERSEDIIKNMEMVLSEGEVPSLDCSIELDVEVGMNPTVLAMDSQGWIPIASYIDHQLATEEQGEWRQIDGIHCGLFKTGQTKIGQLVHVEIYFRLCPDENDFKETKLQDRFSGDYPLPVIVGKTILGGTIGFDFGDYFSITLDRSGEEENTVRKYENGCRGTMKLGQLSPNYGISISFEAENDEESEEANFPMATLRRAMTLDADFWPSSAAGSPRKCGRTLSCVLEENESLIDDAETTNLRDVPTAQTDMGSSDIGDLEKSWCLIDHTELEADGIPVLDCALPSTSQNIPSAINPALQDMPEEVDDVPRPYFLTRWFSTCLLMWLLWLFVSHYPEGTSYQDHVKFLRSYCLANSSSAQHPLGHNFNFDPTMARKSLPWLMKYIDIIESGGRDWSEWHFNAEESFGDKKKMETSDIRENIDFFLEDELDKTQNYGHNHEVQNGGEKENDSQEQENILVNDDEPKEHLSSQATTPVKIARVEDREKEVPKKKRPVLDWIDKKLGWKGDIYPPLRMDRD